MTAGLMTESTDGIHITGTITAVRQSCCQKYKDQYFNDKRDPPGLRQTV